MSIAGIEARTHGNLPADQARRKPYADPIIEGDSGGVRFLFDLAFPGGYPGGDPLTRGATADPVNNQVIKDLTGHGDASFVAGSSGAAWANGAFDFSAVTASSYVKALAAVSSDIWTAVNGKSQRILVVCHIKIPPKVDFCVSSGWNVTPFFSTADGDPYNHVDMLTLGFNKVGSTNYILARRQTDGGTGDDNLILTMTDDMYERPLQVAYWRDDVEGKVLRVAPIDQRFAPVIDDWGVQPIGAENTGDFSACLPQFGACKGMWDHLTGVAGSQSTGFRLYRGFIENLARSGRNPRVVADLDLRVGPGHSMSSSGVYARQNVTTFV